MLRLDCVVRGFGGDCWVSVHLIVTETQVLVSVHLIVTETQVFSGWSLGGQAQHKYNKACVCVVCCVLALLGVARLGREPVAKRTFGR